VNPGAVSNAKGARTQTPAGAHSAYRWTTSSDGVSEAHALVLFGGWQPRAGGLASQRRGTTSSAAAHALAVTVDADPARIDSLLSSIDFGAIAATIAR
jgi:hypothetical protein